jgi:hypothetical protein
MHGTINVKSPNNTSKWQMGFNSAFKGLICKVIALNMEAPFFSEMQEQTYSLTQWKNPEDYQ